MGRFHHCGGAAAWHRVSCAAAARPQALTLGPISSIAALLLVLRVAELIWDVLPNFEANLAFQLWDLALPAAFFGLWVALFLWSLNQSSLLPEPLPATASSHTLAETTVPQSNR
ncbi:MAG: hypothetical protein HC828_15955 [Blastochloris sp.]|nr:hypothetical protein [Blastochloris sp.]